MLEHVRTLESALIWNQARFGRLVQADQDPQDLTFPLTKPPVPR